MSHYSQIGAAQQKHAALRTKAEHYRRMALAIQAGTFAKHQFPAYVPRGNAPEWYRAKADAYEHQSEIAGTLAEALSDAQHQEWLDRRTPAEAIMWLNNGVSALGGFIECLIGDWSKHAQKLSSEDRAHYQAQVQVMMGWLMNALDA